MPKKGQSEPQPGTADEEPFGHPIDRGGAPILETPSYSWLKKDLNQKQQKVFDKYCIECRDVRRVLDELREEEYDRAKSEEFAAEARAAALYELNAETVETLNAKIALLMDENEKLKTMVQVREIERQAVVNFMGDIKARSGMKE